MGDVPDPPDVAKKKLSVQKFHFNKQIIYSINKESVNQS